MKTLIVEDDFITSQVMREILLAFGEADIAEDGKKALELFAASQKSKVHYDVIFLDIMMPEMDGQQVLEEIRKIEHDNNLHGLDCVKIVMTTALDDFDNIKKAFFNQCEGYLVKPVEKNKVIEKLVDMGLVN
jgi:two-component system, chemotaxis family, chemotaxis protein CheY